MSQVANIDDVVARMDAEIERAVREGDPAGYFTALYRAVTERVRDGIAAGEFDDAERMNRFDTYFANRFFDALAAWRAGERTPRAWRVAFQAWSGREATILQHLLLGMNAHINLDLAVAAAEVCPGLDIQSLRNDFERVNDTLAAVLEHSQDAVGAMSPAMRVLDRAMLNADEALVNFSVRRARRHAWDFAQDLAMAPPDRRAFAVESLDRRVVALGRLIEMPGGMLGHALGLVRAAERHDVAQFVESLEARTRTGPRTARAPLGPPEVRTTPWPEPVLAAARRVGDPPADAVVQAVYAAGDVAAVNAVLRALVANDQPVPETLPPSVRDFLRDSAVLPEWAEPRRVMAGQALFGRYGPTIVAILHGASLPLSYAARRGVEVLYRTTRLTGNPTRRVVETAQMIVDVMQPGGLAVSGSEAPLSPRAGREGTGGRGVRSVQKVRLLHAAVRHLILAGHASGAPGAEWPDELGVPVNQLDLAGTLQMFSTVVVDGLQRLGADVHDDEIDGYLHAWRVIGHLMGIEPALNPEGYGPGVALREAILAREVAPSVAGRALTAALIESVERMIPGDLFDGFVSVLVRHLIGDTMGDLLAVARPDWTRVMLPPMRFFALVADETGDRSGAMAALAARFGHALLSGLLYTQRGPKGITFALPTELRQQWGVNWTA